MKTLSKTVLPAAIAAIALCAGAYPVLRSQAQDAVANAASAMRTIADKRPVMHDNGIRFGAYDPHGDFGEQKNVATEHLFLPWEDVALDTMKVADDYARSRGRNLLVTVEPWSWDASWRLTSDELRRKILAGGYDENMRAIARTIATLKSPVIVRWGQEMEDKTGRFSWSGWEPKDYIRAYRHMMDIVRKEAPGVKIMWSPKGLDGLEAYYPGDDYADLIGLSVFGLEQYDRLAHGGPRNFVQATEKGYGLVEKYNKPVWIAELGYEGSDAYLRPWMDTATLKQADFPRLEEVVYFNDRDVHNWPFNLGRPDWRVVRSPQTN